MASTSPTVEVSLVNVEAQMPSVSPIGAEGTMDLQPALMAVVVSPVNDGDVMVLAEGTEVKHITSYQIPYLSYS